MNIQQNGFPDALQDRLKKAKIMAVLVIDDAEDAVNAAKALIDGGIFAMELALRTPASIKALHNIKKALPEMLAGIGTVLTSEQVEEVAPYADLIVTPGCNPKVIETARKHNIPIAPGISSPTDIEIAVEAGCRILKLFPAENLGGLSYLNAINAPYDHLGISYIPLGGVSSSNCKEYIHHPRILCIGGSWIAPRKLIQQKDWKKITLNAAEAMRLCNEQESR